MSKLKSLLVADDEAKQHLFKLMEWWCINFSICFEAGLNDGVFSHRCVWARPEKGKEFSYTPEEILELWIEKTQPCKED